MNADEQRHSKANKDHQEDQQTLLWTNRIPSEQRGTAPRQDKRRMSSKNRFYLRYPNQLDLVIAHCRRLALAPIAKSCGAQGITGIPSEMVAENIAMYLRTKSDANAQIK